MVSPPMSEEKEVSFSGLREQIKEDLRALSNCWFLLFNVEHLPEFFICLNGVFVGIKMKTLIDNKNQEEIADEIRDANGFYFEVSRHNWKSVLKSLEFISGNKDSINN